jgi:hypothetical protein
MLTVHLLVETQDFICDSLLRQQTPPSYYFVTGPPQQLASLYMPRPIEDHPAYENPFAAEKNHSVGKRSRCPELVSGQIAQC